MCTVCFYITDFATQNQLHLCKAQTSLQSNFTWCSQTSPHRKAPPVRKKAPSGRELAVKQTEGERDGTIYHKAMVYAPMLHAISFRLATLDTSLPEGGNREEQAPPLPAQRAVSAAWRYIIKATPCISSHLGVYRFITFA